MTTIAPSMAPVMPVATQTTGCWSSFTNGVSKTASWCGRQVSVAAKAVWGGIQKVASWAATFFKKAAFHCAVAFGTAVAFVKAHSVQFLIGGIALAVGVTLGLIFSRVCGCCNKPAAKDDAPAEPVGGLTEEGQAHLEDLQAAGAARALAAQALAQQHAEA